MFKNISITYEYHSCPLLDQEAEFIIYWTEIPMLGTTKRDKKVKDVECSFRERSLCPAGEGCELLESMYSKRR